MFVHHVNDYEGSTGLWIHGWMGSGEEGQNLANALGQNLMCPDLPGHGQTPVDGWKRDEVIDRIAELASEADWVGGYSMGARLAMMAAMKHPKAFDRLILESGFLGYRTPEERAERLQVDTKRAERLLELGCDAFCEEWYTQPMWAGMNAPPRKGLATEWAEALNRFSSGRQPNLRPWICSTTCRVLWLAGSRDSTYSAQADWVRNHTRHRVQIVDSGHNLHRTDPKAWAATIHHFQRELLQHKEQ
jgi:2-succinyl-6-hydroxy-2,4-cyclohexadiene-1-carboxylate synthase